MLIDALSLKFKPDDYRAKLPVFDYLADLGSFKLRRPVTVFVGETALVNLVCSPAWPVIWAALPKADGWTIPMKSFPAAPFAASRIKSSNAPIFYALKNTSI